MSTADKSMIRQCLFNSTLREIREIEDIDYSFIEASPDFKERIKSSIEATPRKRKLYPKKLIVALVAVISLCFLFVFAVSAQVRTKVVDFFVEVYESFTLLLVKDNGTEDNPDTIESIYEPSYLTENNYEKSKESVNRLYMSATWKKEGSTIEFSQSIIDDNYILSDTEASSYGTKFIGEQEVLYKVKNGIYTIKWLAYGYSFTICCNEALGWDEVEKIVLSVKEN